MLVAHPTKIPEISAAARELVSAYRLANTLERRTLDVLEEICAENGVDPGADDEIPDAFFRRTYASISDDEIRQMVRRTRRIVRLGMKRDLMKATRDITEKVKTTRSSVDNPNTYVVSSSSARRRTSRV